MRALLPCRRHMQLTSPALTFLVLLWAACSAPAYAGLDVEGGEHAVADPAADDVVARFMAQAQHQAHEAFDEIYGDGSGIDGEPPPPRDAFVENYVTQALNHETKRILDLKGYPADHLQPEPRRSRGSGSWRDVEKKDSPKTLEGEVEAIVVQKKQRQAIRERVRTRKSLEVLIGNDTRVPKGSVRTWDVPCGEHLYKRHVYAGIPRCSPGVGLETLPCQRFVWDEFVTPDEGRQMIELMEKGFQGLFHQGPETLLVPESEARGRLGDVGFRLTVELLDRVRRAVEDAMNISTTGATVYYSGSLMKRMEMPIRRGPMQVEAEHNSWNPHVDKANIASYDYSALLYFNDAGLDFDGGELAFHDVDADRMVWPLAGRLLAFSSGLENLHHVRPMTRGRRYVLSMWFTCSKAHAHPSLGELDAPWPEAARRPDQDAPLSDLSQLPRARAQARAFVDPVAAKPGDEPSATLSGWLWTSRLGRAAQILLWGSEWSSSEL